MASSAKRSKARKAKIKKAAPPKLRATSVAPVAGPVTLDEAKAIVRAKQPKLAMHAVRKNAAPPTSPAAVGAERERLEQERRQERGRRIREYKATMDIMKRRGARRPRPKGTAKPKAGEPVPKGGSFAPLQIFAEGDSWFDYPVPFFSGGIISRGYSSFQY